MRSLADQKRAQRRARRVQGDATGCGNGKFDSIRWVKMVFCFPFDIWSCSRKMIFLFVSVHCSLFSLSLLSDDDFKDDDIIFEDFARLRLKGEAEA